MNPSLAKGHVRNDNDKCFPVRRGILISSGPTAAEDRSRSAITTGDACPGAGRCRTVAALTAVQRSSPDAGCYRPPSWIGTCINPADRRTYSSRTAIVAAWEPAASVTATILKVRRRYTDRQATTTSSGALARAAWNTIAPWPSLSGCRSSAVGHGGRLLMNPYSNSSWAYATLNRK